MYEAMEPMDIVNEAYQVYALVDSRNDFIRYVSISTNVQVRYYSYLSGSSTNAVQKRWFTELRDIGMHPQLRILETIEASDNSHAIGCERELH